MLVISQEDFKKLSDFVYRNFGINLSQKKQLVEGRLYRPFSESGYTDFSAYIDHMMHGDKNDLDLLLNRLTTNHSFFMRESSHFDLFRDEILPNIEQKKKGSKTLSVWSAGCSTGQEPYTLSMILKDYFEMKPGWDTRVLATDISQRALVIAQAATYNGEDMNDVPDRWMKKYLRSNSGQGTYTFVPEIQKNVIYRTFNLMEPIRFKMKFDVIFCRNVMIYFDQETKDALIRRFYDATNDGGYLLVGHSETLNKADNPYTHIGVSAYEKRT